MRPEDVSLLGRVSRVNAAAGDIVLRVLTGLADDDALGADFAEIGRVYSEIGADFTRRANELGVRAIEGPAPP